MTHIKKTKHYSWKINNLAKGCKQCVKGEKLVMFITGICPRKCDYCPISEQKKDLDVIFVNERKLDNENDVEAIIEEVKACKSKGAGFTGGDPLSRVERTCRYIKILKENFGKKFHIHLYTSMNLLNEENLRKLNEAGLDELRIHPDLYDDKLWHRIFLFNKKNKNKYNFTVGIEIPVIPNSFENTLKIIDFFVKFVDFINLNELEISDGDAFRMKNVKTRNNTYYGAKGSREEAFKILRHIYKNHPNANVHFCTCKLKDKIQLGERLKRRAKNTAKKFDIVTSEGTLIRGAIYLKSLIPDFNYTKKLETILNHKEKNKKIIDTLKKIRTYIIKNYSIPGNLIEVDELKFRIITNAGIIKKIADELKSKKLVPTIKIVPAIIEQYPTWDQMEIEVEFL
ncbi:MAG: radical SAM protein [Candidatus Woesearchaeota archaeon]